MDDPALAPALLSENPLPPKSLLARPLPPPPAASQPAKPTGQDLALAGIVHDARNLVTALRLCADLIAEPGILAEGQDSFAEQIRGLADASDYIFRRLTSVTRTASLSAQIAHTEVPVADLADAVRQLSGLLSAIAGPGIAIEIAASPCAGRLALSEESLTRILLNLVRNSADAMTSGCIRIRTHVAPHGNLSWLSSSPNGPSSLEAAASAPGVLLIVEDDGPGIPPESLERIFEPGFSTRRAPLHPANQHHGLGLSIVRQLVQEAGGSVRALAAPGRGARFEIQLPLTDVTPVLLPEYLTNDRSLSE